MNQDAISTSVVQNDVSYVPTKKMTEVSIQLKNKYDLARNCTKRQSGSASEPVHQGIKINNVPNNVDQLCCIVLPKVETHAI